MRNQYFRCVIVSARNCILCFSDNGTSVEEGDLQGKLSLLKKYLSLLSHHVSDVMPLGISYGSEGPAQYVNACGILQKDVIGHLLPGKKFLIL